MDGRKNRFVAVGTRKPATEKASSQSSSRIASSDDSSDTSGDETSQRKSLRQKKRRSAMASEADSKRVRREEDTLDDDSGAEDSSPEKSERTEMLEQSLVVSQVAMKLEEYARKAKKGYSLARVSRTRGGVVTPPTRSAFGYLSADTGELLTYDDETLDDDGLPSPPRRRVSRDSSVITVSGENTLSIDQDVSSSFGTVISEASTPVKAEMDSNMFESPPIEDLDMVKEVVGKILASANGANDDIVPAFAAVIGFCMSTAPAVGDELFSKVYHLISSSDKLAGEFHEYRAALHPLQRSSDLLPALLGAPSPRENRVVSVHQIWERNASKVDAVREFKTFAVNYFHKVLLQDSNKLSFTESEVAALRYTADAWLRSVCAIS